MASSNSIPEDVVDSIAKAAMVADRGWTQAEIARSYGAAAATASAEVAEAIAVLSMDKDSVAQTVARINAATIKLSEDVIKQLTPAPPVIVPKRIPEEVVARIAEQLQWSRVGVDAEPSRERLSPAAAQ